MYSSLRRDRSDYSAKQIAQLVVRMLRRREVVRSGVYTHLVTLTQCLQIITDLAMAVRILDKDITQADTGITRAQTRRFVCECVCVCMTGVITGRVMSGPSWQLQ